MSYVKKPVLLDSNLADSGILYPSKGSLKLNMTGLSEASLTLGYRSETIPMHAWVKIYNQLGFVGVFRRTGRDNNVTAEKSYTLRHGIDILQDSVWDAETEFSGTKEEFLTQLLSKQTQLIQGPGDLSPQQPWVLGSCADTSTYKKKINYDNLLSLFNDLTDDGGGYYFVYDQTVWPWTVSLVAKPSAVASEFRLSRNLEKCKIKDNDSELCTRLILSVNQMVDDTALAQKTGKTVKQNSTVVRTYNNTSAQASYGIIVKTADIDVTGDTFPNGPFPEADAWAADFLARRADPQLQVQIDGFVLKGITGEDWDESRIGTVCKVSLPDYPDSISERCVTVPSGVSSMRVTCNASYLSYLDNCYKIPEIAIIKNDVDALKTKVAENVSYELLKRKASVSFIFDDGNPKDADIKAIFDNKGKKCGFAIYSSASRYIDYHNEGYEILAHATGHIYTTNTEQEVRTILSTALATVKNLVGECYGWVTPSSEMPNVYKPLVYDYFQYGYTIYKGDISTPADACMTKTIKSYEMWRTSLESVTVAEIKAILDYAVANNLLVCIYGHATYLDTTGYWTTSDLGEILDYCDTIGIQVETPYRSTLKFLSYRHNED